MCAVSVGVYGSARSGSAQWCTCLSVVRLSGQLGWGHTTPHIDQCQLFLHRLQYETGWNSVIYTRSLSYSWIEGGWTADHTSFLPESPRPVVDRSIDYTLVMGLSL